MSQSFANTNSFELEFGLGSPREWIWPKFYFQLDLLKGLSRYLRYPSPEQGTGYRVLRIVAITVLQVRGYYQQLRKESLDLKA